MDAWFWFIIFATYAGLLLLFGLVAYWGWKCKTTWLTLFGGVSAAGLIGIGVVVCVTGVITSVESSKPSNVFKDTFGELPSAAVSDLKADSSFYFDSGAVYLRFRTTETEFRRLVPSGLTRQPYGQISGITEDSLKGAPDWWTVRLDSRWVYFLRHDDSSRPSLSKRGFGGETEYYAFDPATGTAYYCFEGFS